jgi:hypothetical protein
MNFQKLSLALALSSCFAVQAAPVELVTDGGFESGGLSSWSTTGLGTTGTCPSVGRDWNVATTGGATGCSAAGNPIEGRYAAYVMNDGGMAAGMTYRLTQTIIVPMAVTAATFSFQFSSVSGYSGALRTFFVDVLDAGGGNLGTIYNYNVPTSDGSAAWDAVSVDMTSLLASQGGSAVTLRFNNAIPTAWTGPAGLGLDAVSLKAEVPEPGALSLAALALLAAGAATRRRKV